MATGVGDGTITLEASGVGVAETVEMFLKVGTAAEFSGGTRVGNGDITKIGLPNGTIHQAWLQNKTTLGFFGPGSGSVFLMPTAAADSANDVLARAIDRIRFLYTNSANALAWINAYNAGETTDKHVFLGHDPSGVEDIPTKGPVFVMAASDFSFENTGQNTSYRGEVVLTVRHFWFDDRKTSNRHMQAYNFLWKLFKEILQQDPFEPTHGLSIAGASGFVTQPWDESEDLYLSETAFTIDLGLEL